MPTDRRRLTFLLIALLGVAFILRAPLTAVPPALEALAADLGLSPVGAGMVTTLPLICFGVFAFLAPPLTRRLGRERTLVLACAIVVVGLALRLVVTTPMFFLGTVTAGLGIAVGNVVIPAIVRARFAGRLALSMGLYTVMIQISGSAGAFLTAPLVDGAGWGWSAAIGLWLAPAALALIAWTVASRRLTSATPSGHGGHEVATPLGVVARRLMTWGVVLAMGLQALVYYTLLTWLPVQLVGAGWSVSAAGVLLGVYNVVGIPGSFLGPQLVGSRHRGWWIVAVAAAYVAGILLVLSGEGAGAVVGVLVAGLCQGFTLSAALTMIAHQRVPSDVPAVSALAQGLGYLLAAIGPVAAGALYGATRSFAAPDAMLVSALVLWAAVCLAVVRPRRRGHGHTLASAMDPAEAAGLNRRRG